MRSNFLTAQATARHMVRQGSGVILFTIVTNGIAATGDPADPDLAGQTLIGRAATD